MSDLAPRPPRVLVLSADVGEGHLAAAHAIAEGLHALGAVVTEEDGLSALGRCARYVIRDGYRFQLRFAPWSYTMMYRLFMGVAPARAAGAVLLSALGRRRLSRRIRRHEPDVVVSTHPALTCVLGRMRRRRRLTVPVVAPITDLADFAVWSHRGVDVHLVMHEHAIARVEHVAGRGSAALVRPLVARRFLAVRDTAAARAALGLATGGTLVAVSGGGWGVGDLAGGADAALQAGAGHVVVVAGRNEPALAALRRRFDGDARVTVWGFTTRMDDLLRAADVLVHSTGGVTSLEALSCGCPMIAYGCTLGHIRVHNRTMQGLGLITVADSRPELRHALRAHLAGGPAPVAAPPPGADAAALVAGAVPRIRPLPAWRLTAERAVAPLACAASLYVGVCTDDAYSLVARPLDLQATTHVHGRVPEAALIVRAAPGAIGPIAARLAGRDVHLSFAVPAGAGDGVPAALRRRGDELLPELPGPGSTRWLRTRRMLASAPRDGARRAYLVPAHGMSVGQYLLARSAQGRPIAGQERLSTSSAAAAPLPSAGDVVVMTADEGPASAARAIAALTSRLSRAGIRPVSLSVLLASASTSERTTGERSSATAPPTTAAIPRPTPGS